MFIKIKKWQMHAYKEKLDKKPMSDAVKGS